MIAGWKYEFSYSGSYLAVIEHWTGKREVLRNLGQFWTSGAAVEAALREMGRRNK